MTATLPKFDTHHRASPAALAVAALCLALMGVAGGCATGRLDAHPAAGVNLSGDWQLNPNLSDDPQHLLQDDSSPNNMRHGSGRRRSRGGPPPLGVPAGAGGSTDTSGPRERENRFGHWLDAPTRMSIRQDGGKVTIQSKSPAGEVQTQEMTGGETTGWRGNIFVVERKVKDGPTKEDDYALDDDGRLILSTLLTGGHMPRVEIKRVYDRIQAAAHPTGGPE